MTTRQITRCMFVPFALARAGVGPALALALVAGTALSQPAPPKPPPATSKSHATPPATPAAAPSRSSTADAASSMMSERSGQEQTKKKIGDSSSGGDVQVNANQIVDLHVKDEDLTRVLELLAIQSQRNIIPTKSVSARVSANLYGVTFYEALDALLHPNGFGWMERNNRIEVYTLDELKQIEAASRTRIAKVIKLNYLNAIDAGAFVEALLSEGGQIKTNGKTPGFAIPEKTPVGQDDYANDAMLVVYDFEENVAEIERLIKEIDTRPSQVLVEATILQTQLNEANAFGVDFAVLGDLNFVDFSGSGGPLSAVNGLIAGKSKTLGSGDIAIPGADGEGRAVVSSPGNTAGPGTMKIGFTESDVAVFVKMLDEVGDTTIISNPKVLALNRQPARVLVGRKVGYLNTTSTDTTTTQSVEFLDTGTQLYFRPFVTNEGLIRLELKPAVSEAVIRDAKDVTGAAVTIPDEITNEIVTNVLVRDGQTVVLGGLFRESTQSSRRQVPFLGDIPLLGAAFRGHDDETNRNEIIFMIKPSVVSDQVLVMQGERGSDLIDRARAGSRESLLPWSRERQSGQRLVEAERLAGEGKDAEALWKVEQSLSMNHTQPEAIALRDKLSNKKSKWPGRSMLNDIVRGETTSLPNDAGNKNTGPTSTGPGAAQPLPPIPPAPLPIQQIDPNASATFNPDAADAPSQNSSPDSTPSSETPTAPDSSINEQAAPAPCDLSPGSEPTTPDAAPANESAQPVPTDSTSETNPQDQSSTSPGQDASGEFTANDSPSGMSDQSPEAVVPLTDDPQPTATDGQTEPSSVEVDASVVQLGSGATDAGADHNEQGSTEPSPSNDQGTTPADPNARVLDGQAVEAKSHQPPTYIAAWTWFFGNFRNVFIQGPVNGGFPGPVQATVPADSSSKPATSDDNDSAVSNVPDSDQ